MLTNVLLYLYICNFAARPLQDKEINSLQEFSNKKGNEYPIQLWDVGYWARLQKKEFYG